MSKKKLYCVILLVCLLRELDEDFPNKNPNQSVDKEGRHRKTPEYH